MDKNTLIAFLQDKDTKRNLWGCDYVDTSFPTNPEQYISFAEEDLNSVVAHKYINALSNCKRAIDCQTDRLLKLVGFYKAGWGFPTKLRKLAEFDIVAPKLLEKINRTRNRMEHEYEDVDGERTEDFVSIGLLFIHATNNFACRTLDHVGYTNGENETFEGIHDFTLTIDSKNKKILVKEEVFAPSQKHLAYTLEVGIDEPEYIEVMKYHLKKAEFR